MVDTILRIQYSQNALHAARHACLSRYANGVLGIDPKAARAAWTVFLVALLLATAYAVRETLAVFVIALLFAYLLAPLVGFVERITPRQVSPRIALAIVYLALVGAIVALGIDAGFAAGRRSQQSRDAITRSGEESNLDAERFPCRAGWSRPAPTLFKEFKTN